MEAQVRGGTGSIGVVGGPIIVDATDVTGTPEVPIDLPPIFPCRVIVRLNRVDYKGCDVGSYWRYKVSVNSSGWCSDLRIMDWGKSHRQHGKVRYVF